MRTIALMMTLSVVVLGCGKEGEDSLAKQAGGKLGETITDFASGVGRGVDTQLMVEVELSDALTQRGFSKTVAKSLGPGDEKGISVYLVSRDPFEGKFIARAMNKEGLEIGRSIVDATFDANDAQYVKFIFDNEVDMQTVDRFLLDVKDEREKQIT